MGGSSSSEEDAKTAGDPQALLQQQQQAHEAEKWRLKQDHQQARAQWQLEQQQAQSQLQLQQVLEKAARDGEEKQAQAQLALQQAQAQMAKQESAAQMAQQDSAHRAELAEAKVQAQLAQQEAAHRSAQLEEAKEREAKRVRMDTEDLLRKLQDENARKDDHFRCMMNNVRESGGEPVAKLEQELAALRDQISADSEALKKHNDMTKFEEVQKTRFNSFLAYVRQVEDPVKTEKPSIAILGNRGVGKSSTCNALTGEEFALTGCVDTTLLVTQIYGQFDEHKFEVWDVPGETDTRSYSNLEHLMKMKEMHVIIVQYTESIKMALNLIRLVSACRVPLVIVRNKVDNMTESDAKKEGKCLDEFRKYIQLNEEKTLLDYLKEHGEDVSAEGVSIIFACTKDGADGLGVKTIKSAINSRLKFDIF